MIKRRKNIFQGFKIIFLVILIIIFTIISVSCGTPEKSDVTSSNEKSGTPSPVEKSSEPANSSVSIVINDNEIIMSNSRLKVEVSKPGKDYTAKRFDRAGIVKQVTLDDKHTFLSTEKASFEYDKSLGFGLIAQFEPSLSRMSEGEYTVTNDDNSIIFTKNLEKNDKGRGYKLVKVLSLDGTKLVIKCSLTNKGEKTLSFGEYNHNFTIIDKHPVSGDYELRFSFDPQYRESTATGKNLFTLKDNAITWTKELTGDNEFLTLLTGYQEGNKNNYWILTHKPTGAGVKSTTDFEIVKIQLWGKAHTVCPEVFLQEKVEPGQTFEWSRTYEFFSGEK